MAFQYTTAGKNSLFIQTEILPADRLRPCFDEPYRDLPAIPRERAADRCGLAEPIEKPGVAPRAGHAASRDQIAADAPDPARATAVHK